LKKLKMLEFLCAGCLLAVEKRGRVWVEWRRWMLHPLPCFLQEYDSMGIRWRGCAKNLILKGIEASSESGNGEEHGSEGPPLQKLERGLNAETQSAQSSGEGKAGADVAGQRGLNIGNDS
jgi:hypothetical protein